MTSRAVILAAGRGSRMGPYTTESPKGLLEFAGHPLVEWQANALASAGVKDISVVRGYLANLWDGLPYGFFENPEWETTNMVATLFCAREVLTAGESLVVSYGDIIYEPRITAALVEHPGDIVVAVDTKWQDLWRARSEDPVDDAESLRMDEKGRLMDIGRKIPSLDEAQAQFMGLMKFSVDGLNDLIAFYDGAGDAEPWMENRTKRTCYTTDILRGMIEAGYTLDAAKIGGGWLEFDTQSDFDLYTRLENEGTLVPLFKTWGF